jgi:hypothetical protein
MDRDDALDDSDYQNWMMLGDDWAFAPAGGVCLHVPICCPICWQIIACDYEPCNMLRDRREHGTKETNA